MTGRPRKTPAPVTGGARRTAEPDALDSAPASGARPVKRQRAASAAPAAAAAEREQPPPAADAPQATPAAEPRKKRVARTFYVDQDLLEDARAAVTFLAAYVPEAEVQSLSDLVNPALAGAIKRLQDDHNNGKPFRRVARMQSGRPRQRS